MFGFLKKQKTEVEKYYENRKKMTYEDYEREMSQNPFNNNSYGEFSSYSGDFSLVIEDVFQIAGRGVVVTGKVNGFVRIGDKVRILNNGRIIKETTITGIEMFRKMQDSASTGDNVGLLLRDVTKNDINKGYTLSK